eukprot:XP_011666066.1 PREDICTED: polyhomeotic-like protein 2 [Strongylocentrotus purpuratus]
MAQSYAGHAPRAQTYAPPRRPPPIVNRPKPQRQQPPTSQQRPQKAFAPNPAVKSRSFRMLEEMTQEEEARALEDIQHANKQEAPSANTYRSIDNYEPDDGEPTGRQSRSFRMLQQMTAEEEAMMGDL